MATGEQNWRTSERLTLLPWGLWEPSFTCLSNEKSMNSHTHVRRGSLVSWLRAKTLGSSTYWIRILRLGMGAAIVLRNSQDDSDVHQSLRSNMVHQITDDSQKACVFPCLSYMLMLSPLPEFPFPLSPLPCTYHTHEPNSFFKDRLHVTFCPKSFQRNLFKGRNYSQIWENTMQTSKRMRQTSIPHMEKKPYF